jgi:hypothetical protein
MQNEKQRRYTGTVWYVLGYLWALVPSFCAKNDTA